jgi:hypothetical protein
MSESPERAHSERIPDQTRTDLEAHVSSWTLSPILIIGILLLPKEQTCLSLREMSAFDPKRTCAIEGTQFHCSFTACSLTHSAVGRSCQASVKPSCNFGMIR